MTTDLPDYDPAPIDVVRREVEDELTETIGRPIARSVIWAVERYFDVTLAIYRLHNRLQRR